MSNRCTYCGRKGHWRPDCPEIRRLLERSPVVYIDLVSTPIVAHTRKLKARWRVEHKQDSAAFSHTGEPMKQVRVSKAKLLSILKTNRTDHREVFLQAQKTFRVVAIKALDEQLKAARKGRPFVLASLVRLEPPEDHTVDYDRSIQMLEMSVDSEIVVDEREFQNYVQDKWQWSRDWAANNMRYINNNSRHYGKLAALSNE